jgi:hypothetical protein
MNKIELTEEQKEFQIDPFTLNSQFRYWLLKSKCMWNLKETNKKYKDLRISSDHATAMENLKTQMFLNRINI